MHLISLSSSKWRQAEDVWVDLLAALKAPSWHGQNLNALWDTVCHTPVNSVLDMSKETANLAETWGCLEGADYDVLLNAVAYGRDGYYAQSPSGGTYLLAPTEGILLVGGYE